VKSSPVKFVENSNNINGWVVMGIEASQAFFKGLLILTDMQISMYQFDVKKILRSTFSALKQQSIETSSISIEQGLHNLLADNERFIYSAEMIGMWNESPIYIVFARNENKAYLSNDELFSQLVIVLVVAALWALFAAMLLSHGITRPLNELISVAKKISGGEYLEHFPSSSTNEVETLSTAISDMQQSIKEREKEINHLAFFDPLTSLPNRNQFNQYIKTAIESEPESQLIVLMLDVDRFKEINDTVGHEIGDILLNLIAQRLITNAKSNGFFARLGGDEFGVVFSQIEQLSVDLVANTIVDMFEQPFYIDTLVLDINCCVGATVYPDDAKTSQGLLQCADIAMHSCKEQYYQYAIYKPELNKHSVLRLSLMSELNNALNEGQLVLYYQPKLSIQDNCISTAEYLIRWIHPVHGFIPPDEFIPLAEQTGAIRNVTHWALNRACEQLHKWRAENLDIGVAVNISAMDLVDMKLPLYIADLLVKFELPAKSLTVEVTESAVMTDPRNALKALNTLRTMGIVLSIDDFGTGYSSMAQLKKIPVDELKIDKEFVLDLANNKDDQIMVKILVSLAQSLGMNTVAEGVEDLPTLDFLREIGCTKAQGFYLSKALPIEQFDAWYQNFLAIPG
jgi:diguanylate cyclase (GGDEF)-like protein